MVVAPTASGKYSALPRPYAKNSFATLKQRSVAPDAEHALAEQLGADDHVVLQVHAAFRRAGAAGRVQPERRRVAAGRLGLELGGAAREQQPELGVRERRLVAPGLPGPLATMM